MSDPSRLKDSVIASDHRKYIPIEVSSLRTNTVTGFDLYHQVGADQPLVLYREQNLAFTDETRVRLQEHKVDMLYVDSEQHEQYRQYVEANLLPIMSDDSIEMETKSEILYSSALGLVEGVLQDPRSGSAIKRSKALVEGTVSFMFNEKTAFQHLLKVCSYDYTTYAHCVNVFVYSVALAQRLGYEDEEQLHEIGKGALLHDIGKSVIDPNILKCEDKLTINQWETLMRHTVYGAKILSGAGGVSSVTIDIVRHHHEKLNGKGYPDGLRGDKISAFARIVGIADIFDALTTNRPQRKAWGTFDALKIMRGQMAKELDPEILNVFIKMLAS